MKNLIRILLYLLLVLLVVAISVVMYKKFKAPEDAEVTAETTDSLMVDTASVDNMALTAEDSIILGLTGELPQQVGAPDNGTIDYTNTQSTQTTQPASQQVQNENVSPVAKPVANTSASSSTETKRVEKKAETVEKSSKKPASSTETKPATSKSGKFYVVAGSYIVPSHADKQVAKLKKMGYASATSKVFGTDEYYRAIAGQYESRQAAEKTVKNLKNKGLDAFIKTH